MISNASDFSHLFINDSRTAIDGSSRVLPPITQQSWTFTDIENEQTHCSRCEHNDVCKYREKMKDLLGVKDIGDIPGIDDELRDLLNININIKCNNYKAHLFAIESVPGTALTADSANVTYTTHTEMQPFLVGGDLIKG